MRSRSGARRPGFSDKMATRVTSTAFLMLTAAFILNFVGFIAPYWLRNEYIEMRKGLFAECTKGVCTWFFQDDNAWERHLSGWYKSCQALFGFGLLIQIGMFAAIGYLLCTPSRKDGLHTLVFGSMLLVPITLIAASIILYAVRSRSELGAAAQSAAYTFDWAFYAGVGGLCCLATSSFIFLLDACYRRTGIQYHRGDVL